MVCAHCGAAAAPGDAFCRSCGKPIATAPATGWDSPAPAPPNPRPTRLIVLLVIAGVLGAVLLALVLSAETRDDDDLSVGDDGSYPASVRRNFMTTCTAAGGPTSYCECAFDEIERTVPFEEFVEADRDAQRSGELPPRFAAIFARC